MVRTKTKNSNITNPVVSDKEIAKIIAQMDAYHSAESINENVIMPFILALENVCEARGYLMNIFGNRSNLTISSPEEAETIYHLIEEYLDSISDT